MKFCPNCGKEVSEGGKWCTNCGKMLEAENTVNKDDIQNKDVVEKQEVKKNKLPDWALALIIMGVTVAVVIVILLGIGYFFGVKNDVIKVPDNNNTTIEEYENIINNTKEEYGTIGDTLSNNTWKITLLNATYYDAIYGDYFDDIPEDGKYYLVFFFEVENISNETEFINYLYFSGLEDKYTSTVKMLLSDPEGYDLLSGDVPAGAKKKGYIAFEVYEDWQEFDVSYKEIFSDDAKLTFGVITKGRL